MLLRKAFLAIVASAALGLVSTSCTKDESQLDEVVKTDSGKHAFSVDKDGKVSFKADIVYFKFDDYTLTQEGMDRLDALAGYLKDNNARKLKIEGHCDERGTTEYNLALGQLRTQAVVKYLSTIGIAENRLASVSFGEERPASIGHQESNWALNRRAEFVFVQ